VCLLLKSFELVIEYLSDRNFSAMADVTDSTNQATAFSFMILSWTAGSVLSYVIPTCSMTLFLPFVLSQSPDWRFLEPSRKTFSQRFWKFRVLYSTSIRTSLFHRRGGFVPSVFPGRLLP
jgi:hypothetical protein